MTDRLKELSVSEKTLSEIERNVASVSEIYAERFGIDRDGSWYLAKLTEELGELTAADLKCSGKARTNGKTPEDLKQALANEAADLFAHLLLFCQDRKIDLEQAVKDKWLRHLGRET